MRSSTSWLSTAALGLLATSTVQGVTLNIDDQGSIKTMASGVAYNMMTYYVGNQSGQSPGMLPGSGQPNGYYWWEGGGMFGALVDYWWYTGDPSYNEVTSQALLFQSQNTYEPVNVTKQLGNDDQAFWAMAALLAAETGFPNPPPDQPQWLALAQGVINRQIGRWDYDTCNGGLRWQFTIGQKGWTYKNSISNACLLNMCARVGRYTGNTTYTDWVDKTWDWMSGVGLLTPDYDIYDGVDLQLPDGTPINCTHFNKLQFSYSHAATLYGAAMMWNMTQDGGILPASDEPKWRERVSGLLQANFKNFFNNANIMQETACESAGATTCNMDMKSYKAYNSRWLGATAKIAPWTANDIMTHLRASAQGAAQSCTGGGNNIQCGLKWTTGSYDGSAGIGEQMSVLQVLSVLLQDNVGGPFTADDGGTSKGDASAGNHDISYAPLKVITTADKAGAGIITFLLIVATLAGAYWLSFSGSGAISSAVKGNGGGLKSSFGAMKEGSN